MCLLCVSFVTFCAFFFKLEVPEWALIEIPLEFRIALFSLTFLALRLVLVALVDNYLNNYTLQQCATFAVYRLAAYYL